MQFVEYDENINIQKQILNSNIEYDILELVEICRKWEFI